MDTTRRHSTGDRGATLALVALLMPLLLLFLALAVDMSLGFVERRRVQNAADAGALAAIQVLAGGGSDAAVWREVRSYTTTENEASTFRACYITTPNGPCALQVGSGSIPTDVTGVRVTANGTIPTFLGAVTGIRNFSAEAVGAAGLGLMDIVMVFDKSGSMDDDSCYLGSNIMLTAYPPQANGSANPALCNCTIHPLDQSTCPNCYLPEPGQNCSYDEGRTYGVWRPASEPQPQPITDAKAAASAFVDMNNGNIAKIALVAFASPPVQLSQPLSADFGSVKGAIAGMSAGGDTATASAIQVARTELTGSRSRDGAMDIIVLLTDGKPNAPYCSGSVENCPAAQDATRQQARDAAASGITIYTIALGARADRPLMEDVAQLTGGKSYYAPTSDQLAGIYRAIFGQIMQHLVE